MQNIYRVNVFSLCCFFTLFLTTMDVWAGGDLEKLRNKVFTEAKKGIEKVATEFDNGMKILVGKPLKAVDEGIKGGVIKPLHKVGDVVEDILTGTTKLADDVLKKPVTELGKGMTDVTTYIEENPIEAAVIIFAVGYGGYLISANKAVYGLEIILGPVGIAKTFVPENDSDESDVYNTGYVYESKKENNNTSVSADESSDTELQVASTDTIPTVSESEYLFIGVPERTLGPIPTLHKIDYAMKVEQFVKNNSIDMYSDGGLPDTITLQERKMIEVKMLLSTIPKSAGDRQVEQRDEANAIQSVVDSVVIGLPKSPAMALWDASLEGSYQLISPSVISEQSLAGQIHINDLKRSMDVNLNEYIKMRVSKIPEMTKEEEMQELFKRPYSPDGYIENYVP